MPKKMCAKHNKQSPKILVTHMDAANTTSASEKAKYQQRGHTWQRPKAKHTEVAQNLLIKE